MSFDGTSASEQILHMMSLRVSDVPSLIRGIVTASVVAIGLAASVHGAWAQQDYRVDPFQPNPTPAEDALVAERARIRNVLREMIPEIRSLLARDLDVAKKEVLEESRRTIIEAIKADPTLIPRGPAAAAPPGAGAGPAANPNKLPEGAKFLACINGKALYRDTKENVNFFREAVEGQSYPCIQPR